MTSEQIVYQQRVRRLAHAVEMGNVTETCRVFGVSTKTFHKWRSVARSTGWRPLWLEEKRPPMMPNATPTHVVEVLLTLVVTLPTLGCRQYADRLADHGFGLSKSTVQNHLVTRGLGRRAQRLARAAAIAAATTGLVTEAVGDDMLFGFCHWARSPMSSWCRSTVSTSGT